VKKLLLLALGLVAAVLPLGGCASNQVIEATLGQTFDVPIHREAFLPAENLRLTFQEVSKDSRCPRGVQCVTAGEAVFTVRFTRGSAAAGVTFTALGSDPATATFLDYSIAASLQPYPEQAGGIPPEDYVVQLTITHPPVADALPEDDMAAVYAAVIRRLLTTDSNNPPGALDLSSLYLLSTTSDATPINPTAAPDPHLLTATLRDEISSQLADLSAGIHWVAGMDSLSFEGPNMTVAGGGVVISLGNIHPGDGETCQVYGALQVGSLDGTGRVYVLAKTDGTWQITGTTGPVWMS
jgi:hypothetical protein